MVYQDVCIYHETKMKKHHMETQSRQLKKPLVKHY
jgi:hypothetical protein